MLSWSVDISNSGFRVSGLSIDPIKPEQWPLENNPQSSLPLCGHWQTMSDFSVCVQRTGGKIYMTWGGRVLINPERIPEDPPAGRTAGSSTTSFRRKHRPQIQNYDVPSTAVTLKSIASGPKQACGSEKKKHSWKTTQGHATHWTSVAPGGLRWWWWWAQQLFFFFSFLHSVSCIDCGNRERMSWLRGRVQGFSFFLHSVRKRGQRVRLAWVC